MSHLKEREQKNCLNCNAQIVGRYCHICGQENIEPKESVGHLVSHFFQDITHFDGKFFTTLKLLLFKPGFLSQEYLQGRRASYLHPIRMYLFTSAFFFLIFFNFYKEGAERIKENSTQAQIINELKSQKLVWEDSLKNVLPNEEKNKIKNKIAEIENDIALIQKDSTAKEKLITLNYTLSKYASLRQYDSLQKALPKNKRDGFWASRFERQTLHLKEKYKNNGQEILQAILENFMHHFPQMLFVSLPLFALLLKLLYIRHKNIFYVNHLIYAIHLYCACFILILLGLWAGSIFNMFRASIPNWLNVAFALFVFFYCYKTLKNFYDQRRAKTLFKFIVLLFFSLVILILIFIAFLIFSTFTI